MKKILILMLIVLMTIGYGCAKKETPAINIGNIDITAGEFEEAFKASRFATMGNEGRKIFLEHYISSKLILKEAEEMGLDKDPQFLRDIQSVWEAGLLKLVLSQKTKELALKINVSDKEINDYYEKHKVKLYMQKELPEVYDQIKWVLLKGKQSRALAQWVASLKNKSIIKVRRGMLGITKE